MNEYSQLSRIIWESAEAPTNDDVLKIVKDFYSSNEYKYLEYVGSYYDSKNHDLMEEHRSKKRRGKTPNYFIPTAYYTTLTDSISGYMFNNVVYTGDSFADDYNEFYQSINGDTIDMQTGQRAIAFNKGCEIVYTYGDGVTTPNIGVVSVDPRQMIFLYSNDIEPKILYGLRCVAIDKKIGDVKYEMSVDVISPILWRSVYISKNNNKTLDNPNFEPRIMNWSECPCIEFNTEVLNNNTAFHQVIPYINALDALITGNSNELDKLADAILKLSATVDADTKKNMSEWKVIEGLQKDDIAEYIQRQVDPTFREYLSKLLIQEIHKHSHVIDFYSPDSGISGDASGKALKTRLIDMNMFCDRTIKNIKIGFNKRIRLISEALVNVQSAKKSEDNIKVIFNYTPVVGVEDIAPLLSTVTFMSEESKQELSGLDPKKEKERMGKEKSESGIDVTDMIGVKASAPVGEPVKAEII